MNPRTLITTVGTIGAIVALAAPTIAGAKTLPTNRVAKHAKVAKHSSVAKPMVKRQGQPLQRVISVYGAGVVASLSPDELCNQQNEDAIAHALEPVDCSAGGAQPAASDMSTETNDAMAGEQSTQVDESATASGSDSATSDSATDVVTVIAQDEDDC
jgi:hypothetical protein